MRVAIIGTGYVGLVSGACLADFGHEVVCVDSDSVKIEALKHGEIPIYEPGLLDLVRSNVKQERLSFASAPEEPVRAADVVFIAVGTPSRRGDGHADLSYVYDAARDIAAANFPTQHRWVVFGMTPFDTVPLLWNFHQLSKMPVRVGQLPRRERDIGGHEVRA